MASPPPGIDSDSVAHLDQWALQELRQPPDDVQNVDVDTKLQADMQMLVSS